MAILRSDFWRWESKTFYLKIQILWKLLYHYWEILSMKAGEKNVKNHLLFCRFSMKFHFLEQFFHILLGCEVTFVVRRITQKRLC